LTYRGFIRHQTLALALDDPPVRLGLAMHIEIERRLLERLAQTFQLARVVDSVKAICVPISW